MIHTHLYVSMGGLCLYTWLYNYICVYKSVGSISSKLDTHISWILISNFYCLIMWLMYKLLD